MLMKGKEITRNAGKASPRIAAELDLSPACRAVKLALMVGRGAAAASPGHPEEGSNAQTNTGKAGQIFRHGGGSIRNYKLGAVRFTHGLAVPPLPKGEGCDF